jgi:hypothetical protein
MSTPACHSFMYSVCVMTKHRRQFTPTCLQCDMNRSAVFVGLLILLQFSSVHDILLTIACPRDKRDLGFRETLCIPLSLAI